MMSHLDINHPMSLTDPTIQQVDLRDFGSIRKKNATFLQVRVGDLRDSTYMSQRAASDRLIYGEYYQAFYKKFEPRDQMVLSDSGGMSLRTTELNPKGAIAPEPTQGVQAAMLHAEKKAESAAAGLPGFPIAPASIDVPTGTAIVSQSSVPIPISDASKTFQSEPQVAVIAPQDPAGHVGAFYSNRASVPRYAFRGLRG